MQHRFNHLFAAAAALASLAGPAQAADATDAATAPQDAPLVAYLVSHEPGPFRVTSLLSLEFGQTGQPAALAHGASIVAAYHVSDPAELVAATVAKDIATSLGGGATVKLDGPPSLKDVDPAQGRYLVTAQTESWGFDFFTLDPGHYRAVYAATLTIRDNRTHGVIGRGWCRTYGSDPSGAPTGKELLADDAARLKALLAEQAAACVTQFELRTLRNIKFR